MHMNELLSPITSIHSGVELGYVITFFGQTPDHFNSSSKFRLQAVFVLFLRHAESQQGWNEGVLTS